MKALLIARRELVAYLRSPLGSVIIAAVLVVVGLYWYSQAMSAKMLSAEVLQQFFYTLSGAVLISSPVLAMRLIAEERQTGTMTLLNTAPIKDRDIVIGKFLSAYAVFAVMIALTLYMPLLIKVHGKVSIGHIFVGYIGVLLLGSATLAIGLFGSTLARSQVVALILIAAMEAVMVLMWLAAKVTDPPLNDYLSGLALHHQNFAPFMNGVLELRGVVYYLAVTYFFLLAATKTLEARRWR
jgi:ABC-2 type transport system permease protein